MGIQHVDRSKDGANKGRNVRIGPTYLQINQISDDRTFDKASCTAVAMASNTWGSCSWATWAHATVGNTAISYAAKK